MGAVLDGKPRSMVAAAERERRLARERRRAQRIAETAIEFIPAQGQVSLSSGGWRDLVDCIGEATVLASDEERLLFTCMNELKRRAKAGPFALDAEIGALAGCPRHEMAAVLEALGFVAAETGPVPLFAEAPRRGKAAPRRARASARQRTVDPHSPFAKLAALRPPNAAR